jgi:hypothetical protein
MGTTESADDLDPDEVTRALAKDWKSLSKESKEIYSPTGEKAKKRKRDIGDEAIPNSDPQWRLICNGLLNTVRKQVKFLLRSTNDRLRHFIQRMVSRYS